MLHLATALVLALAPLPRVLPAQPGADSARLATDAPTATAPTLTAELLVGHPGLFDGRYDAVRADWLAALAADPTSPLARQTVASLLDVEGLCAAPIPLATLRELRDAVVDGRARDLLAQMEEDAVWRTTFSKSPAQLRPRTDLDEITDWFVIGPIGPLDRYEPLWGPQPKSGPAREWRTAYATDFGTEVHWKHVAAREGTLDPDGHVHPAVGGELYLAAWFECELESATIELYANFPVQVYWNGELALEDLHGGLTEGDDLHTFGVDFAPGPNALVLRCDNGYAGMVRARVLALGGTLASGEVVSSASLDAVPAAYPDARPHATPPQRIASVGPDGAGGFEQALAILEHRHDGTVDEALTVAEPVEAAAIGAWLYQRYFALANCVHLPDEVQRRRQMELERRMDDLDLDVPELAQNRAFRLLEEDRPEEALEIARELTSRHPDVPRFATLEFEALSALDPTGTLELLAVRERLERHEDADTLGRLAGRSYARNDRPAALALHERAARLDGRRSAGHASSVLGLLSSGGRSDLERALEWIATWRAADPDARWLDDEEARVRRSLGDTAFYEQHLRSRIADFPFDAGLHGALGDHLLEQGRDAQARDAYLAALDLDQSDTALRQTLGELGVPDPAEDFFRAFAVDRDAVLAHARDEVTDASTSLALDGRMVFVRPDGSFHVRDHTITTAHDRTGTEMLHESPVVGEPHVAQVLDVDGGTFEPIVVDGSWVMPSLDPGDAVELVFDNHVSGTPGVAPQLGSWMFESFEQPFLLSRLVVFLPDGTPGRFELHEFDGTHEMQRWETPSGPGTVHVFETRDRVRLPEEPARPTNLNLLGWLQYGEDLDLAHLAEEQRRDLSWSTSLAADVELELRALARRVAVDRPQQERARALYDAITEHVLEFSGDGDTTDVWTMRRGRPLGLLAALYELAGVEFEWAVPHPLLPEELAPVSFDPFVSRDDFGEPLIRLAPTSEGAEPTWLLVPEGGRGLPFGRLRQVLAGGRVVVLGATGPRFESLPAPTPEALDETELVIHLADDKSASVSGTMVLRDFQGPALREALAQAEPQQREQWLRQFVAQKVGGIDLESFEFVNLDVRGADLELRFAGTVQRFVRGTRKSPYLEDPVPGWSLGRALGSSDRVWPLELLVDQSQRVRLTIHPSEGYALPTQPEAAVLDRPGLFFSVRRSLTPDGSLVIERDVALRGLRVAANDVGAFLAELTRVEELLDAKVELTAAGD
jgi:tetratricopeptide (TPR) repeat protein